MADRRDTGIDFIKGMLIFGVVYGHLITALTAGSHCHVWLHIFMRTFDMPFFMLLSGFFFRKSLAKNGYLKVLLNRLTMILVPIVFWTVIRGHLNIFGGMYYFLWAVFASGVLCLTAKAISSCLPERFAFPAEITLLFLIAVALHCFNLPWNLFYLYPFFAVGYCMPSLPKQFPQWRETMILLAWVTGLCFWGVQYAPWNVKGMAWRSDGTALIVYGYRFVLALLGVHVMWKVFVGVRRCLGEESWFVKLITWAGTETLAIYIVHIICMSGIKRLVPFMPGWTLENASIVGYVLAPIMAILMIGVLLPVIGVIKKLPLFKYAFGFKAG